MSGPNELMPFLAEQAAGARAVGLFLVANENPKALEKAIALGESVPGAAA